MTNQLTNQHLTWESARDTCASKNHNTRKNIPFENPIFTSFEPQQVRSHRPHPLCPLLPGTWWSLLVTSAQISLLTIPTTLSAFLHYSAFSAGRNQHLPPSRQSQSTDASQLLSKIVATTGAQLSTVQQNWWSTSCPAQQLTCQQPAPTIELQGCDPQTEAV